MTMETPPLNTAIHDHIELVSDVCEHLEHMARAARTLGMDALADELQLAVCALPSSAKAIAGAYGQELNAHLRSSQETAFGLLRLATSGALRTPAERKAAAATD